MSTTDLPGSSLLAGRYRLVERLGAGGMSVVWRGFDEVLGRQVAVKVLPPSTSTDPSFRRRLRAEAQAAARLSHPHITNVYDYGEAITVDGEPVPYVVMELVDGESLAAVLARSRRLPWPAAVRISSEVSAALAAAHARGIVHRDVTPANVMLTPSGAKVVDFGISALIGENDIDPDGSLLGTPAYLAPERLEGGQVSPATDVYAVGLLIYRTLIGQLPWDVGTTTALLRAHQYTEPEPLPYVEGLPPAVEALIARCLEKCPDDRPSSAELAHVLAGVAASTPSSRGFVPDWADSSEDTTILPSALPDTGGIRRARHGQASVADLAQPGRGAAAVRGVAAGPGQVSRISGAPISPAPGSAVPVSISEVEAAMGGRPAADRVEAPALSARPGQGGGRNSRFAAAPRGAAAAAPAGQAAARGLAAPPSVNAVLRPAYGAGNARVAEPLGKPAGPPPNQPPVPPDRTGGGPGKGRSGTNQSRRVLVVAGLVALLGGGTYAVSLASVNLKTPSTAGPSVVPVSDKCVVSYTVWSDNGKQFKASVSVANRDSAPIKNWKLWFLMPGDQIMSGKGKQQLTQEQGAVTVSSETALAPQATNTMQITGRYKEDNHPPMVFKLAGRTCETYVSGKPGAPSQPVEHLSDDTTRLGPVPPTQAPAPGLSTGPGGVIVPVPVDTTVAPRASTSVLADIDGDPTPSDSPVAGPPPDPNNGTIGGGSSSPTPTPSVSLDPPASSQLFSSAPADPTE